MRWPWIGNYPQEPEDINYNPGQKCWDTKQVLQSPSYNVENRLFCPLLLKTRATFSNIMIRGNGEYVIQLKCQNYVCLGLWTSTQKPPTLGFNRTAVYTLCRSGAAMLCQSRIIRMILCHHLLTTSQFALIAKRLAQLFKFVVCNAFRYSPSLSILIALWF